MNQLIVFRALQGLGAGAIIPSALTIIGEIYTLEQRARMQGVFSSVWGVSSIIGPILGGYITDNYSWRWIFYINIPFGLLAIPVISLGMKGVFPPTNNNPKIDYAGAISLSSSISFLLLACLETKELSSSLIILFILGSLTSLIAFIYFEKHAAEPILPLHLFQEKIFIVSTLGNFLAGCVLFGTLSFIPLFMQIVLKTTATQAGKTIMFLLFSWICSSILSARLILNYTYRPLVITGMLALTLGSLLLSIFISPVANKYYIYASVAVIGIGMGLSTFSLLIAIQSQMPNQYLGIVTSSTQFFRSIGGVIGTGVLGSIMSFSLSKYINQSYDRSITEELTKIVNNPSLIFDPITRLKLTPTAIEHFSNSLALSLHLVFIITFFLSLIAFGVSLLTPTGEAIEFKKISLVPNNSTEL
jgi:MFS family permease